MTLFLMIAVLMTATALAFVLPPLFRKQTSGDFQSGRDGVNLALLRDQLRELDRDLASGIIDANAYDSARRELEQRVAEDVKPDRIVHQPVSRGSAQAIAVSVAVMIGAAGLYGYLGKPAGLDPAQASAANVASFDPKDAKAVIEQLAQRLKTQPENAEGWTMLARTLNAMGRYADASRAFQHLSTLVPNDAQLLTEYAGSLAMAQGASLQGEPERILGRALTAEPNNTKALSLSGSAAFERGEYEAAIAHWKKVLAIAPADSEIAQVANDNIKEAVAAAGNQRLPADARVVSQATQLAGVVELAPELRAGVNDTDTVFVFAKASEGPRFPLAVLRKQVKDLPFNFVLDDSMSMTPEAKLSGFASLEVTARISTSGNAIPEVGDLEGSVSAVRPGAKELKIRIGSRRSQ